MTHSDENCPNCLKPQDLCICASIRPLKTKLKVLILQHPQEPDKELGSARLAHLALPHSTLKIGLSWPNIRKALGQEAEVTSARWAVLYLGSGVKDAPSGPPPSVKPTAPRIQFVSKAGIAVPASKEPLEGIVVLDGTWSQAKALWWRNAWLLKLKRVILNPAQKSLYSELRREPRRECLSTIESLAECLSALGEPQTVEKGLKSLFGELLEKHRARPKSSKTKSSKN
ncbi:tRNA-uridine aminocarboxypropyltransferase [Bdellovibrionota bacterium FG-1]